MQVLVKGSTYPDVAKSFFILSVFTVPGIVLPLSIYINKINN